MTEPGERQDIPDPIGDTAQDWVLRLNAGGLALAERERFEAWCAADPRHRAAYDEVRALWDGIDGLEHAFAPHRPRVEAPPASPPPARFPWRPAAAAGLIVACLVLFVAMPPHLSGRLLADHSTAVGQQRTIALPDGSVAYLNTDTAIDVAYSDARRQVRLLYGEALFEVRKDPARPFDVLAVDGRTTAVGTTFVVKEGAETALIAVTEGAVRVASPDAVRRSVEDPGLLVEAGQQVSYRRGAAPDGVQAFDLPVTTAWRQGAIVIRDRPLAEALIEIGRYHQGRIVLLGDASRLQSVTARLSLADLDGGIDALAATNGLSVTRVTDYLTIVR